MQVQGSSISKNSCQTKLQPEIRVLRAWLVYVCQKGSQCSLDVRLEILHHLESEEAIRLSIGFVARKLEYRHIYNLLEGSEETSMCWRPARRQPCPWWWTERMCQRQGHKRRRRQKVRSVAGCSHDLNEKNRFKIRKFLWNLRLNSSRTVGVAERNSDTPFCRTLFFVSNRYKVTETKMPQNSGGLGVWRWNAGRGRSIRSMPLTFDAKQCKLQGPVSCLLPVH